MRALTLFTTAAWHWWRCGASRSSAVLAYFLPFTLVPLLFISVTLVGLLTDPAQFANLLQEWGEAMGLSATDNITTAVASYDNPATVLNIPGLSVFFFAGMIALAFHNVAVGLRLMWDIPERGMRGLLATGIRSVGFFLLLQVFFVAVFCVEVFADSLFGDTLASAMRPVLIFVFTVALFTVGYRVLSWGSPSRKARFVGAIVVAVGFAFLRILVGWWLLFVPAVEQFGPAGFVFSLLVWIYLAAMIFYFGAAFAWAFDYHRRSMPRA